MSGYSNQEILRSIQDLTGDLSALLPPPEDQALAGQLQEILSQVKDPDRQPGRITQALEAIREYPAAQEELKARLIRSAGVKSETRLGMFFEPTPGIGGPVPPGTRVACPVEPTHYIIKLRVKGQRCPLHNVELVPADSIRQNPPAS